jgi:hypothetical protein
LELVVWAQEVEKKAVSATEQKVWEAEPLEKQDYSFRKPSPRLPAL